MGGTPPGKGLAHARLEYLTFICLARDRSTQRRKRHDGDGEPHAGNCMGVAAIVCSFCAQGSCLRTGLAQFAETENDSRPLFQDPR